MRLCFMYCRQAEQAEKEAKMVGTQLADERMQAKQRLIDEQTLAKQWLADDEARYRARMAMLQTQMEEDAKKVS